MAVSLFLSRNPAFFDVGASVPLLWAIRPSARSSATELGVGCRNEKKAERKTRS
jgi:hypothetical protein